MIDRHSTRSPSRRWPSHGGFADAAPRARGRVEARIYKEACVRAGRFYHVPNHHGADFFFFLDKVWTMYEPWLASLGHQLRYHLHVDLPRRELSLGHTFPVGGDTPALDTVKVGLLGADLRGWRTGATREAGFSGGKREYEYARAALGARGEGPAPGLSPRGEWGLPQPPRSP